MGLQQRNIAGNTTYRWKCDIDGRTGSAFSSKQAAQRSYEQHMFNEHQDEEPDEDEEN